MNFMRNRPEPMLEPLPISEDDPEVKAFLHNAKLIREERNMYRDQCGHLSNELRLANERLTAISAELKDVKRERDFYQRHSLSIRKSLGTIKLLIVAEEEEASKHALAEPEQETEGRQDTFDAVESAIGETKEAAK